MEYPLPESFDRKKELDALWSVQKKTTIFFGVVAILIVISGLFFLFIPWLLLTAFFCYHYLRMKKTVSSGSLQYAAVNNITKTKLTPTPELASYEIILQQDKRVIKLPILTENKKVNQYRAPELNDLIPVVVCDDINKAYYCDSWLTINTDN